MSNAKNTTAGATKAYGASRGAARRGRPRGVIPRGPAPRFTSAGLDREAALLHVRQHRRLDRGEGAEERALARGRAAEIGRELAVGDVHVRAPGDLGGLRGVLLAERPEVRLVREVRGRGRDRGL